MCFVNRVRYYYAFLVAYVVFQILLLGFMRRFNHDTHFNAFRVFDLYKTLAIRLNEDTEVDNSGIYKILYAEKSNYGPAYYEISLVSQCSSNHLFLIENLVKVWNGPISVAVFSEIYNVEKTVWEIAKFIHCYSLKRLDIHLVLPAQDYYINNFEYGYNMLATSDKSLSCSWPEVTDGRKNYNWTSPYPINFLRNVAKKGSLTEYILVIDIDMKPSSNLHRDFMKFMKSRHLDFSKEVYVVPTFEIAEDAPMPRNKAELMKRVKLNQAQPFYLKPCRNCQKLTKYSNWLLSKSKPGTRILYRVNWKHPWEPFFIAKRQIPDFDERFKQYGMNRISQICELHILGYKFLVLDNVFLLHKGFKTNEGFHATKEKEMEDNRRLYARFKIELKYIYRHSNKSC